MGAVEITRVASRKGEGPAGLRLPLRCSPSSTRCCSRSRSTRTLRPLGVVLVPLALLLSLGTVYGQLHYAVDALAGAAVGLCVDGLGRRAGYDSAPV